MSSWLTLSPTEEHAAERIEQVQTEVQQTETSQTTEEREISTTQQHNVPETEGQLMGGEHRVTPPPTAPVAQRLLRARSHLAPFSFPQVGLVVYSLVGVSHVTLYYFLPQQVLSIQIILGHHSSPYNTISRVLSFNRPLTGSSYSTGDKIDWTFVTWCGMTASWPWLLDVFKWIYNEKNTL